jgi:hypothetical protein
MMNMKTTTTTKATDAAEASKLHEKENTAEYGTEAHDEALNALCDIAEKTLPRKTFNKFEWWCLKATSLEIADEALRLIKKHS